MGKISPEEVTQKCCRAVDLVRTATGDSRRAQALSTCLGSLSRLLGGGALEWAGWADLEGETRAPRVLLDEASTLVREILSRLPEIPPGGYDLGYAIMEPGDAARLRSGCLRALSNARRNLRRSPPDEA